VCLRNDWADLDGANLKPLVPERSETDQAKSAVHYKWFADRWIGHYNQAFAVVMGESPGSTDGNSNCVEQQQYMGIPARAIVFPREERGG